MSYFGVHDELYIIKIEIIRNKEFRIFIPSKKTDEVFDEKVNYSETKRVRFIGSSYLLEGKIISYPMKRYLMDDLCHLQHPVEF